MTELPDVAPEPTKPMTEAERDGYIAQGGQLGALIAKISRRAIDAETELEVCRNVTALQRTRIAELEAALADATRDATIDGEIVNKVAAVIREGRSQRAPSQPAPMSGSPAKPRDLKVVQMAATDAIERALQAG